MSGPCTSWISGIDVAGCCSVVCDDPSDFDDVALQASDLLFELSGRRFAGECETTVRPCRTTCGCPWQILSRGHIVWNPMLDDPYYGWWMCNGDQCGCTPLSRVLLAGSPVTEITEVLIDGDVVDPATYRLDNQRWLTRMRDPADPDTALVWPGCQNLDLNDDQEGTFAVSYTFGEAPPRAGVAAAGELACELFKACSGAECALPSGTTRVTRQGLVIEKRPFTTFAFQPQQRAGITRGWATGMALVDAFLNAYNPTGSLRQPIFWSPATSGRYAQKVG